jgi:hypothetical protein
MAHYGKTLRDEMKVSGGAEEDLAIGAPNKAKSARSIIVGIVFTISLGFFYKGRWVIGVGLLVVSVALLFLNAPSGGAFYKDDNSVPPEDQSRQS